MEERAVPPQNARAQLLPPDTVLHERYRIERHIGSGGYANVYRAIDLQLRRECAIKEVFDTDPAVRKQFEVEAGLLVVSRHPNIPRGYKLFEDRGRLYLVMDFVRGRDLEDLLNESLVQRRRPLDEPQVLKWAIEVCGALMEMHDRPQPVFHRDIKPANIKITPDGHPVLIDFGLAKIKEHGPTATAAQGVSPGFAPPEQYMAKGATDARTDIYGLGATLYACLTGKDPPDAPSRLLAQTGMSGQPMIPPRELAARQAIISEPTNRLVVRALELAPSQRQQTARELRDELLAALSGVAGSGRRPDMGVAAGGRGSGPFVIPGAGASGSGGLRGSGKLPAAPGTAAMPAAKPPVAPPAKTSAKPSAAPAPKAPPVLPAAPAPKPPAIAAKAPLSQAPARAARPAEAMMAPAAPAPLVMPPPPVVTPAPSSGSRASGKRSAVAVVDPPATRGAVALADPIAAPAPPVELAPNSRKRRGEEKKPKTVPTSEAGALPQPRSLLDLKGSELTLAGKVALALSAVEACWGIFLVSIGGLQFATRGQDRLQPYFLLALVWMAVLVLVIAVGGHVLSRPVRRRGKLGRVRRGLQGTLLALHALALHGLAIWGAIVLVNHIFTPQQTEVAFGLFAANVLIGGLFALINTLG